MVQDRRVVRVLPELEAVPAGPVQHVVDPLGQPEERLVAVHQQPACVDAPIDEAAHDRQRSLRPAPSLRPVEPGTAVGPHVPSAS